MDFYGLFSCQEVQDYLILACVMTPCALGMQDQEQ